MTLKEYLKENKPKCIATIILDEDKNPIIVQYNKREYNDIDSGILNREVMETNEEEDCMEVYLYEEY